LIRKHFFLAAAVCVLFLMLVAGVLRLTIWGTGSGGPPGAGARPQAGQRGAPPGGKAPRGGGGGGGFGATVTPATVAVRTFTDHLEVLGVAKGRQSVTLTSNAAELVTGVRFRDGQAVAKGQVLVDLQSREEDAGVAQAQATMNLARLTYERWKKLGDEGYAPKATVDQYQAALVQAQAALTQAKSRRQDRAIRAPFAGVVGLSDIAPGALINPGTPIVSLDDLSLVRVDFDIPDRFLSNLSRGLQITATSDAYPNEIFHGVIAQFDTRVNEQTRALRARAEFPNPGTRLKPGMLLRVAIAQGSRQALGAPEAAVQFSADSPYVYVIADVGGRTVAQQRTVLTGADEAGFIEIKDGLRAGETIVADGMNRVQPNQPLKVVGPGAGLSANGRPGGGQRPPPAARPAR
jgi:membrane fusion protein (multidrug efflux system)